MCFRKAGRSTVEMCNDEAVEADEWNDEKALPVPRTVSFLVGAREVEDTLGALGCQPVRDSGMFAYYKLPARHLTIFFYLHYQQR